jgi:hypothetical protein
VGARQPEPWAQGSPHARTVFFNAAFLLEIGAAAVGALAQYLRVATDERFGSSYQFA